MSNYKKNIGLKMKKNPQVYFDISIEKRVIGRIIMELFADVVPRTAENFRVFCTGERGISGTTKKNMHYKGTIFHRIISGFMAQGGDTTRGDGTGGESIYGNKFHDENFRLKHDQAGLLSMANSGLNTNGSQFFLTFKATPHLNGRHVVFGKVIEGLDLLKIIERVSTDPGDKPFTSVYISDCGQIHSEEEDIEEEKEEIEITPNNNKSKEIKIIEAPIIEKVIEKTKEEIEAELELEMTGMNEMQRRLFKIRMKINQGNKANKSEVESEYKRFSNPDHERKQRYVEKNKTRNKKINDEDGEDVFEDNNEYKSKDIMSLTAEQASRQIEKDKSKASNMSTFGWQAFSADAEFQSYSKKLKNLPTGGGVEADGNEGKIATLDPLAYGSEAVSTAGIERLSKDVVNREAQKGKFSRHRMNLDPADVDFINDKNAHFNKKLKRSFDKFTVEIRQNLERGTAL
jgi:cyclophilin family peptidyl-prolyl cis-trans isomerase